MYIKVRKNGSEIFCGPLLEWWRHHYLDYRLKHLFIEAVRADGQEIVSGREIPDATYAVRIDMVVCNMHDIPGCSYCRGRDT